MRSFSVVLLLPLFVLAPAACSTDTFSAPDGGANPDASTSDAADDARADAPPAGPCKLTSAWSKPKAVPWVPGDAGPPIAFGGTVRFDGDERVAVFDEGSSGIWFAARSGDTWFGKKPFAVQLAGQSYHPTVDGNAKRVWFANDSSTVFAIYTQSVGSAGAPVVAASVVGHAVAFPYVLPAGDVLYAASDDQNAPIYRFALDPTTGVMKGQPAIPLGADKWAAEFRGGPKRPTNVAVSSDEREMMFGTGNTSGTAHVYVTQRGSASDQWPEPTELVSSDGTLLETPDWLSVDHCRVYFRGYQGNLRAVFVAERAN